LAGVWPFADYVLSTLYNCPLTWMLWVGTYAPKGEGGLYPLTWSQEVFTVGEADARITNASWAVWSGRTQTAYFVEEQDSGCVTAWSWKAGSWQACSSHGTGGALPCYLALHPTGELLAVANYGDGSIALICRDAETGDMRETTAFQRSSGRGSNPKRQAGPHAHCALFDEMGDWLFHVDLGLDRVFRYRVHGHEIGEADVAFAAPPGCGPRHLALHPDGQHALLLCELSANLLLLERTGKGFTCRQSVATAPEPVPENLGGHLAIAPDGRVLVTNRGHDSLVVFALEAGGLRRMGWAKTGGASPRHFHVIGDQALMAHEESGTLSLLSLPLDDNDSRGAAAIVPLPGAAFVFEVPLEGAPDG
jgi:6-phosphogluconolactonase